MWQTIIIILVSRCRFFRALGWESGDLHCEASKRQLGHRTGQPRAGGEAARQALAERGLPWRRDAPVVVEPLDDTAKAALESESIEIVRSAWKHAVRRLRQEMAGQTGERGRKGRLQQLTARPPTRFGAIAVTECRGGGLSRRGCASQAARQPGSPAGKDGTHPSCTRRGRPELLSYYGDAMTEYT